MGRCSSMRGVVEPDVVEPGNGDWCGGIELSRGHWSGEEGVGKG